MARQRPCDGFRRSSGTTGTSLPLSKAHFGAKPKVGVCHSLATLPALVRPPSALERAVLPVAGKKDRHLARGAAHDLHGVCVKRPRLNVLDGHQERFAGEVERGLTLNKVRGVLAGDANLGFQILARVTNPGSPEIAQLCEILAPHLRITIKVPEDDVLDFALKIVAQNIAVAQLVDELLGQIFDCGAKCTAGSMRHAGSLGLSAIPSKLGRESRDVILGA